MRYCQIFKFTIFGIKGNQHAAYRPSSHMGRTLQTGLMVEIYSKSLVRAIGKIMTPEITPTITPIKPIKVLKNYLCL